MITTITGILKSALSCATMRRGSGNNRLREPEKNVPACYKMQQEPIGDIYRDSCDFTVSETGVPTFNFRF